MESRTISETIRVRERADTAGTAFEKEQTPPTQLSRKSRHRRSSVRERANHRVEAYASRRSSGTSNQARVSIYSTPRLNWSSGSVPPGTIYSIRSPSRPHRIQHVHALTYIKSYMYTYVRTSTHIHTYVHIQTYVHTSIYIYSAYIRGVVNKIPDWWLKTEKGLP